MEQLELEIYTLDKALAYFKRNKPQIETVEDIFSLFDRNKLKLSVIVEKALLVSTYPLKNREGKEEFSVQKIIYRLGQQEKEEPLEIIELANYEGKLTDIIKNKEENRFVSVVKFQDREWVISNIWSERISREEELGRRNPHDPNIDNHMPEEGGKPFLKESIVITKENFNAYLETSDEQNLRQKKPIEKLKIEHLQNTALKSINLLHDYYYLADAFKILNKYDTDNFHSIEYLFNLVEQQKIQMSVKVDKANLTPIKAYEEFYKLIDKSVETEQEYNRKTERLNELKRETINLSDIILDVESLGVFKLPPEFMNETFFGDDETKHKCVNTVKYNDKTFKIERDSEFNNDRTKWFFGEDTFVFTKANLRPHLGINTNQSVKKVKQTKITTQEKYKSWQLAVNRKYQENKLLSHSAICTRIAPELGVVPETIRRNTNPPKK